MINISVPLVLKDLHRISSASARASWHCRLQPQREGSYWHHLAFYFLEVDHNAFLVICRFVFSLCAYFQYGILSHVK